MTAMRGLRERHGRLIFAAVVGVGMAAALLATAPSRSGSLMQGVIPACLVLVVMIGYGVWTERRK